MQLLEKKIKILKDDRQSREKFPFPVPDWLFSTKSASKSTQEKPFTIKKK